MADTAWKKFERYCAQRLGTHRIPVTGIDREGADLELGMFCYQAKLRKVIPAFLFTWLAGIVGSAKAKGKIGVLVLNRPRKDRTEALVVVRFDDWVALHGDIPSQLEALKQEVSK